MRAAGKEACRRAGIPACRNGKGAARSLLDPGILPAARKRIGAGLSPAGWRDGPHRQCNTVVAGSFQEVMASWRPVLARGGQARDFADGTCQHVLYGCGQRNVFKSPFRGIRDGPQFAWRTRSGAKASELNARGGDLGHQAV